MGLMPATGWELAIQLAKLLEYLGIASLSGGTVCLLWYRDGHRRTVVLYAAYIGLGTLLGFNGALFSFLFQVGMTTGRGLAGMFDADMASMLLGFEIGSATLLRLAGFLIPTVACAALAARLGNRAAGPKPISCAGPDSCFRIAVAACEFHRNRPYLRT